MGNICDSLCFFLLDFIVKTTYQFYNRKVAFESKFFSWKISSLKMKKDKNVGNIKSRIKCESDFVFRA